MAKRSLVSFDWAMKRLLRNKANFEVLEGFLSELFGRKITIRKILESESNKANESDKYNQVDILVEDANKELVIVEVQYNSEVDYFQRMLYGASKVILEYMHESDIYQQIRKVYSVNIVYFDLGQGSDYVYHGFTDFKGMHTNERLELSSSQRKTFDKQLPGDLHPEYYIIKVNQFDDVAKDTLDQWIYYLKHNEIKDGFHAQGLEKVRQVLKFDKLSPAEQKRYQRRVESKRVAKSVINTAVIEGREKGFEEGIEKGRKENLEKIVINCYQGGFSLELIQTATGLSVAEIEQILQQYGLG